MNIVIIEDENITAKDLAATIAKAEPSAQILATLSSVKESLAWFNENNQYPDLIFSDIQLGDGLSFDIFNQLQQVPPVIFCTAYDQYTLKAFESSGIHYLLKPFDKKMVADALGKFHSLRNQMKGAEPNMEKLYAMLSKERKPLSILVFHRDRILSVSLDKIALFYIEEQIIWMLLFDGTKYAVDKTMESIEEICSDSFFRTNRQYLVNRKAIIEAYKYFNRQLALRLTIEPPNKVTVSRYRVSEFLEWLTYR
jgi:DNA-binding LytR/AlgR family response regulator